MVTNLLWYLCPVLKEIMGRWRIITQEGSVNRSPDKAGIPLMAFHRHRGGFTMVEVLIVVVIIVMLVTSLLTVLEIRHRTIVRTTAVILQSNLRQCVNIAAMSSKEKVAILFRPSKGPYKKYTIQSDIQKEKEFHFPPGVKLSNTNGFIKNHILRIGMTGLFIDEFGEVVKYPNPGILTLTSPETSRVYQIRINPETGEVKLK